jgi:hypothetical protein
MTVRARLASFALILVVAFAAGWGIGGAVNDDDPRPAPARTEQSPPTSAHHGADGDHR